MSERPDFATLMGEHASTGSDERKIGDEWTWGFDCECGEFVPDRECNQHLADAINAAIDRWLADEGTRERVAEELWAASPSPGSAPTDAHRAAALAALAALATDAEPPADTAPMRAQSSNEPEGASE
jgi:hypothetical protein